MTFHNIKDFGLSADQLEEKYEQQGAHPEYRRGDWVYQAGIGRTVRGYWEWVVSELEKEQDQLDRDNPYTQHIGSEL